MKESLKNGLEAFFQDDFIRMEKEIATTFSINPSPLIQTLHGIALTKIPGRENEGWVLLEQIKLTEPVNADDHIARAWIAHAENQPDKVLQHLQQQSVKDFISKSNDFLLSATTSLLGAMAWEEKKNWDEMYTCSSNLCFTVVSSPLIKGLGSYYSGIARVGRGQTSLAISDFNYTISKIPGHKRATEKLTELNANMETPPSYGNYTQQSYTYPHHPKTEPSYTTTSNPIYTPRQEEKTDPIPTISNRVLTACESSGTIAPLTETAKDFLMSVANYKRNLPRDTTGQYDQYFEGLTSNDGTIGAGLKFLRGGVVNEEGAITSLDDMHSLIINAARHGKDFSGNPGGVALLKGLLEVASQQNKLHELFSAHGKKMIKYSIAEGKKIKNEQDLLKSVRATQVLLNACPPDLLPGIISSDCTITKEPMIVTALKSSPEMFKLFWDKATPETRSSWMEKRIDIKYAGNKNPIEAVAEFAMPSFLVDSPYSKNIKYTKDDIATLKNECGDINAGRDIREGANPNTWRNFVGNQASRGRDF